MLTTDLMGATICFRLSQRRTHADKSLWPARDTEPNPLHKTRGIIRVVYLDERSRPAFLVEDKDGDLRATESSEMIVCRTRAFNKAVQMLEKEDAEQ